MLSFHCLQLKVIHVPKWHILGSCILLPPRRLPELLYVHVPGQLSPAWPGAELYSCNLSLMSHCAPFSESVSQDPAEVSWELLLSRSPRLNSSLAFHGSDQSDSRKQMVLTKRTFFKGFIGSFYFYPSQILH